MVEKQNNMAGGGRRLGLRAGRDWPAAKLLPDVLLLAVAAKQPSL
jgi:hypothetical protein